MNTVRQLRKVGFPAFIAALLAMNCGEQEFDLLPLDQENASGGAATGGEDHQGGAGLVPPPMETGGASTGGRPSTGGRGQTGGVGNGGRGGVSSGPPPCEPPVCCVTSEDCTDVRRPFCLVGGVCQECYRGPDDKPVGCGKNELCANSFRCVDSCINGPCPGQFKCRPLDLQCVECLEHEDCVQNEYRKLCWGNACVACRTTADCPVFMTCNGFNTCV